MNALGLLFEPSFTSRLCLALLHSLWQIGLVALVVWIIERCTSQRSVESRYQLHVAALLLALATVPLTFLALDVPQELLAPTAQRLPAAEPELAAQPLAPATTPAESQDHGPRAAEASSPAALACPMPAYSTPLLPAASLTRWIAGIYALGVVLMFARLLRGMWLGQRMIARAQILIDGPLVLATRRIAERWKLVSLPRLAISDALSMPCVTGVLRPTIVFPLAALSGMSPAELELILAHELAHVRRHDLWIHLLQRLAEALLFFNPGLWYLSRRLSTLREYCCDELACGLPASSTESTRLQYAAALVHSAELQLARRGSVSGSSLAEIGALAATDSSPSELRRRVARILHEPVRDPVLLTRAQVVACVALIAALAIAPAAVYSGNQDPADALENKSADSSVKQSAAEPEGPAARPDPFTRTLKSGAVVKVLGIGTRNEKPDHWWHPDGNPFEGVPYQVRDNDRYNFPGPVTREVVFAVEKVPEDATIRVDTSPASANWGNGGIADADGDRLAGHYGRIFTLAQELQTFELKVEVASGEWETVAACEPTKSARAPFAANGAIITGPYLLEGKLVVTVSHELPDRDTRLVIIDKAGKTRQASGWYREKSGKNLQVIRFEFALASAEVARLEFQARDFEWVSFDELPVDPVGERDVVGVANHAKGDGADNASAPGIPFNVRVVAIGALEGDAPPKWWDTEGNVLQNVSFNVRERLNLKLFEGAGVGVRVLVFELPESPKVAGIAYEIVTSPEGRERTLMAGRTHGPVLLLPDYDSPQFLSRPFFVAKQDQVFNLRVGVATDQWQTVFVGDTSPQSRGFGTAAPHSMGLPKGLVLSGVVEKNGVATVVASHTGFVLGTRVVAIDKSGKAYEPSSVTEVLAEQANQSIYEFKGIAAKDIKALEFQTHEYNWLTIDNLPAQPKP